ncbi:MAG TPA: HlyD family efflux transporter periplasmic adaptor subunit [Caulobacteraceae bacterium]
MDRKIERKRWRKYAPWAAGAAVLAGLAAVYLAFAPGGGAKAVKASELEITEVKRAPFHDYVPARGEVTPLQTVYIAAVEGGQVGRLVAADGDVVQAGALLAVLVNPQLEREVGAREADVTGRIADVRGQMLQIQRSGLDREREVNQARFELLRAEQNLQIRRSLHQKGFLSDAELETITAEAAHHRTRVNALRSGREREAAMTSVQVGEIRQTLAQLQENLFAVRRSLDALQLRAPAPGRLTAFELQPGQTVERGQRIGQIDTEGAYKLTARVDEFNLGRVNLGQTATARHEGRVYRLRVSRILPQVSQGGFVIELAFEGGQPPSVRRGQTLDVELTLGDTAPALILPNGAFVEATGARWVFVVEPGGRRAERRAVQTGRRNPLEIEVLGGLNPGERVVTSSYDGFAKQTRLILR